MRLFKKKEKDKAYPDLRNSLRGRVTTEGPNHETVFSEHRGPDIVSPGLKEPASQTTHE